MEKAQQVVNTNSLLTYMLISLYFITQVFNNNKKAQDSLFNNAHKFRELVYCSIAIAPDNSYLDFKTRKDQYCLFNSTPLDCITGCIIDSSFDINVLENMRHKRLIIIYEYISSYCSVINSHKLHDTINQANKLAAVIGDIESDNLGEI